MNGDIVEILKLIKSFGPDDLALSEQSRVPVEYLRVHPPCLLVNGILNRPLRERQVIKAPIDRVLCYLSNAILSTSCAHQTESLAPALAPSSA